MTPRQFEIICGLEKSRDWRRTIHYEGDTLKALIQRNILRPHAQVSFVISALSTSLQGFSLSVQNIEPEKAY